VLDGGDQGPGEHVGRAGRKADRDRAAGKGVGIRHVVLQAFDLPQHRLRMQVQGVSGAGRADAAHAARQQARAEFRFQVGDLGAERGLGDVQVFRRLRHASELNDPQEIAQLSEFHRSLAKPEAGSWPAIGSSYTGIAMSYCR
jgi:hypothetical protein